jgi:hypothetical protein
MRTLSWKRSWKPSPVVFRRCRPELEGLEARCLLSLFGAPTPVGTVTDPQSVAVGDFNGDGKADLAVVGPGADPDLSILLGNGDGTFQTARDSNATPGLQAVTAGDFNGDGKSDLAVRYFATETIGVLLGNGDGTFQPAVNYDVGMFPDAVVVGDVNGDGKPDLVSEGGSLFVPDRVSVLLNNGAGAFTPAPGFVFPDKTGPGHVAVGDVNGDGRLDVAVVRDGSSGASLVTLLGNGDGSFVQASGTYAVGWLASAVVMADFNGDGRPDVAVADLTSDHVEVLLGNGDGTFQAPVAYAVGAAPQALAVGDFNGDGRPDLVTANQGSNSVSVLLGTGTGTFQTAVNFDAGDAPLSLAVGDFNRDGRPDLAVPDPSNTTNGNTASVLLNQAHGFVDHLYQDLLGRPADDTGRAYWNAQLQQGTTPADVARGILSSLEYRLQEVRQLYTALLHRAADSFGLDVFSTFLGQGGTPEQVAAAITGSPEYAQLHGNPDAGFLAGLYQDALGRTPDPTGQAVFGSALAAGASRTDVAAAVFGSVEYRQDLVQGWYHTFLHRSADPTGLAAFTGALAGGQTDAAILALILGSDEYRAGSDD